MNNPIISNPNDHKVVQFHNSTDFTFTPEMGCMFDGRPISGITGAPGINAGESLTLPYHIAHQLALNLAKYVGTRNAPSVDPAGIPTGVPLWDDTALQARKNSYLTDLYTEERPAQESETDRLMAKVEEYKKMVDLLVESKTEEAPIPEEPVLPEPEEVEEKAPEAVVFQDKQDVIAELDKRGIKHDKRKNVAELSKLLAEPVVA